MSSLEKYSEETFAELKETNKAGNEFWSARQLAKVLGYSEYRHILPVVKKAKTACFNSGQEIEDHFEDVLDMIEIGKGGTRKVEIANNYLHICRQNADSFQLLGNS